MIVVGSVLFVVNDEISHGPAGWVGVPVAGRIPRGYTHRSLLKEALMPYDVACTCGNVYRVPDNLAGTAITCTCGRTLRVPSSHDAHGQGPPDVVPEYAPR